MDNFIAEGTQHTPNISMNASTGVISMSGQSYPENTFEFYQPVMAWLLDFFASTPQTDIEVNMEIIYFNSGSSKFFFDFFDIFDAEKNNYKITINWIYNPENTRALEAGEDFIEDFVNLSINLVTTK